jgi:hypothetical protein
VGNFSKEKKMGGGGEKIKFPKKKNQKSRGKTIGMGIGKNKVVKTN